MFGTIINDFLIVTYIVLCLAVFSCVNLAYIKFIYGTSFIMNTIDDFTKHSEKVIPYKITRALREYIYTFEKGDP